jgi:hypothetical protein
MDATKLMNGMRQCSSLIKRVASPKVSGAFSWEGSYNMSELFVEKNSERETRHASSLVS